MEDPAVSTVNTTCQCFRQHYPPPHRAILPGMQSERCECVFFSRHLFGITAEMHNNKLGCGECAAQSVQSC